MLLDDSTKAEIFRRKGKEKQLNCFCSCGCTDIVYVVIMLRYLDWLNNCQLIVVPRLVTPKRLVQWNIFTKAFLSEAKVTLKFVNSYSQ
jgi:hypothetical protein